MFLGDKIKELRQAAGLTWEQLADKAGVSIRTIAYLESKTKNPQRATLRKLADALDVPYEELEPWLGVKPQREKRRKTPC